VALNAARLLGLSSSCGGSMFVLNNRRSGEIQTGNDAKGSRQQCISCLSKEHLTLVWRLFVCDQSPIPLVDSYWIDLNSDVVLTESAESVGSDGGRFHRF